MVGDDSLRFVNVNAGVFAKGDCNHGPRHLFGLYGSIPADRSHEQWHQGRRQSSSDFFAEAKLLAHGIVPWTELPLWLPESDPTTAGFMSFSCGKAMGHGLRFRPLEETLADTAGWLAQRDNAEAWRNVLSAPKEDALLQSA